MNAKRLTLSELAAVIKACKYQGTEPLLDNLEASQVFDFGRMERDSLAGRDLRLQLELWRRGLLRLPFERTVFMFLHEDVRLYLVAAGDVKLVIEDPREKHLESLEYITAILVLTQHELDTLARPDAMCVFGVSENHSIQAIITPLTKVKGETEKTFEKFATACVSYVISFCMALNTKGVPVKHEPAPVKVNAKRARSGKPPISAITYVDMSKLVYTHAGTGHGSPKSMHLRRGHLRHYDDGSVTWVRDCIVKADGDLKVRERYQVRGEPKHENSNNV